MSESLIPEECQGWRCGEFFHPILRDAQKAALEAILKDNLAEGIRGDIAALLVGRKEEVLRILSIKEPKSRKPRSDKGVKRKNALAPAKPGKSANPTDVEWGSAPTKKQAAIKKELAASRPEDKSQGGTLAEADR